MEIGGIDEDVLMCYLGDVSGFSAPDSGLSAPRSAFSATRAGRLSLRADVVFFVFACTDADVAVRGLAVATLAVIVVPAVIAVATASAAA